LSSESPTGDYNANNRTISPEADLHTMKESTAPTSLTAKAAQVEARIDSFAHVDVPASPEPTKQSEALNIKHRWWGRVRSHVYDRFLQPLLLSANPPWFDARGVSLGFVAGFIVPIGGQLFLIGILRMLLRFNVILALSFSLVSNPFTVIPLYRSYYGIGRLFIGKSGAFNIQQVDSMMDATVSQTYAWDSMAAFSRLGADILLRWFIGALVFAMIFGTIGYILTYFFQTKRRASPERHP
jgi:uncharacterized protein (DUF2062 family)